MAKTDRNDAVTNDAVTTDPSNAFPTKYLPAPEVRDLPLAALVWSILLFGVLATLTFQQQISKLLGG